MKVGLVEKSYYLMATLAESTDRPSLGYMRQARIKIDSREAEALYHCMSRTVNGEFMFTEADMEFFRTQLWRVAEYCGVQVLTYTFMANHFHVVVRVPKKDAIIGDEELLRRYHVLNPKLSKAMGKKLDVIVSQMAASGSIAAEWRKKQYAQMCELSCFMKLVKQRFSIGYNAKYRRFGPLWAERFKSVLVEDGRALETMSAYVDLNAVRSGLVGTPEEYRFCGYAEAVAGVARAQEGIASVMGMSWEEAAPAYRQTLFGAGSKPKESGAAISPEAFERVLLENGELPDAVLLRHKLRFMTTGAVLGSRIFVEEQMRKVASRLGLSRPCNARKLPCIRNEDTMTVFRGIPSGAHLRRKHRRSFPGSMNQNGHRGGA